MVNINKYKGIRNNSLRPEKNGDGFLSCLCFFCSKEADQECYNEIITNLSTNQRPASNLYFKYLEREDKMLAQLIDQAMDEISAEKGNVYFGDPDGDLEEVLMEWEDPPPMIGFLRINLFHPEQRKKSKLQVDLGQTPQLKELMNYIGEKYLSYDEIKKKLQ